MITEIDDQILDLFEGIIKNRNDCDDDELDTADTVTKYKQGLCGSSSYLTKRPENHQPSKQLLEIEDVLKKIDHDLEDCFYFDNFEVENKMKNVDVTDTKESYYMLIESSTDEDEAYLKIKDTVDIRNTKKNYAIDCPTSLTANETFKRLSVTGNSYTNKNSALTSAVKIIRRKSLRNIKESLTCKNDEHSKGFSNRTSQKTSRLLNKKDRRRTSARREIDTDSFISSSFPAIEADNSKSCGEKQLDMYSRIKTHRRQVIHKPKPANDSDDDVDIEGYTFYEQNLRKKLLEAVKRGDIKPNSGPGRKVDSQKKKSKISLIDNENQEESEDDGQDINLTIAHLSQDEESKLDKESIRLNSIAQLSVTLASFEEVLIHPDENSIHDEYGCTEEDTFGINNHNPLFNNILVIPAVDTLADDDHSSSDLENSESNLSNSIIEKNEISIEQAWKFSSNDISNDTSELGDRHVVETKNKYLKRKRTPKHSKSSDTEEENESFFPLKNTM